ncbi:MAG TPA: 23S rRNA (adenine(2030)-N(6))-methyltransferase RlmJ [Aestuariivirgaceae bacterium]|jgi:23S rRNA (adenine2030-N6)-methyltransferase|nr:23S rRNA (adenine(2030)-N(6))-methyltransferase RlmJ [Aestuariivirgaceae bacterium]
MNYRHAFHAGGHADVLKHVVLAAMIERLKAKEAPFRVLDTHAGIGVYDLAGDAASRTGEWRDGVGRLYDANGEGRLLSPAAEAVLAPWRAAVAAVNQEGAALRRYPGSPEIARLGLRPQDRLALNELHPEDHARLAAEYRRDARVRITSLDATLVAKAQLPPTERRGIILIDPAYEATDDPERAIAMLAEGHRRFSTGVFALWYPMTGDELSARLRRKLRALALPKLLDVTLAVRRPVAGRGLAGSGLVLVNPPWRLAESLRDLLPELVERLRQGNGATAAVTVLAGEELSQ